MTGAVRKLALKVECPSCQSASMIMGEIILGRKNGVSIRVTENLPLEKAERKHHNLLTRPRLLVQGEEVQAA